MANETSKIPIQLKLVTEIHNGKERETHSLHARGTLYEKDEAVFLAYEEEQAELQNVKTLIKVKNDEALILRSGGVSMRQTFKKGETTSGTYKSPYGTMEMISKTDQIKCQMYAKKGKIMLAYHLEMQGEKVGRYRLTFFYEYI